MFRLPSRHKILLAVAALLAVLLIGTVGYAEVGGWSWFDSFYFTVITVFGIGYGEHVPMPQAARYFTVGLIILGFSTIAYAASVLLQAVVESQLIDVLGRRRMQKEIHHLRDHYIVCGAGRMGARVIREMQRRDARFVVIESDEAKATGLRAQGLLVLTGDATNEDLLREAGVDRATGIVCAVASDADNLFITLNARDLNRNLLIVTRANDESAIGRLRKAGANKVVSPIVTGSHQMAQMVLRPAVADFIDIATMREELQLAIEQVEVGARSPYVGTSLADAAFDAKIDVIIIAIRRAGGRTLFNPPADTMIEAGDTLVIVGGPTNCEALERLVNPGKEPGPARSATA